MLAALVAVNQATISAPRLVVVISIDQFRGDYVHRFAKHWLPARTGKRIGGFRFLMETGADFQNAMHNHTPTVTGVGHATLMTGSEPAYNGIIGNDWYDPKLARDVYCTEDPEVETVGGLSKPMSPKNLKVTTVGTELKMATNGKSKVVGVALKDRASILMAGHSADVVLWFDNKTGNFVTSTWYAPTKALPEWVQDFNAERRLDKLAGQSWEPLLPENTYDVARLVPDAKRAANGKLFSHALPGTGGEKLYGDMWTGPWGNDHTLAAAGRAIDAEQLGKDEYPDVLVINLSSNDYVGHSYGPNSPEVMDITIRTDRQLSEFLNLLNAKVPGGIDNVCVVVSGDHGVVPIARESRETYKVPVDSGVGKAYMDAINKGLGARFKIDGKWVVGEAGPNIYLNHALAAQHGIAVREMAAAAVEEARGVNGIWNAFTREQLLNGWVPDYPFRQRITNGYHAKMGGDIYLLEAPGFYLGGPSGTGHHAIWDYDAHVPILFRAKGIKPGHYLRLVYTNAIAPTISKLLGIEAPSGNVGVPLVDEMR